MNKTLLRGLPTLALSLSLAVGLPSCTKDLDRDPPLNQFTAEQAYSDPANYLRILARLYGSYSISGQGGPGNADVSGLDAGTSPFLRTMWYLQEISTDEAIWTYENDIGGAVGPINRNTWTSANPIVQFMFVRCYFIISQCNEYLRQTTDDRLSDRGITGQNADNARAYRAEARFLRALAYWYVVDMYGKGPFVTEKDAVGYFLPKEGSRQDLFNYVESECKEIEGQLPDNPGYGRAGKAAVWTLLSRLYLNAEVYTGQSRATDCITYAKKVIDGGGKSLVGNYRNIFKADNDQTSADEIIFALTCDGAQTQSYGNTTFLVNGSQVNQMDPLVAGTNGKWQGLRARRNLPLLFGDSAAIYAGSIADQRFTFFTSGQTLGFRLPTDVTNFRRGLGVQKWSNALSTQTTPGVTGNDPTGTFADTDFPMMRLSEVYLTYAEAVLRGGSGGDANQALELVNKVRRRGYGLDVNTPSAVADVSSLSPDFMLAERGRELYWEGFRRTDLVRFGKYTNGNYNWQMKNNVLGGAALDPSRNLFPIPVTDLVANPNLTQNPGY